MSNNHMSFESAFVHEVDPNLTTKPHVLPIYASSSFQFQSIDEGIEIFKDIDSGHVYSRYGNPTVETVAKKIADLETFGLDIKSFGLLCSSGMAAISTLISSLFKTGDTILTQGSIYGGTTELFMKVIHRFGIRIEFVDLNNLTLLESRLKNDPSIRGVYFETPSNPALSCVEIAQIGMLCKKYDKYSIIDNTFSTPYLQQPFKYGIDYIIHSTTKYLNGHGNSIAGAIVGIDRGENKHQIWETLKLMGGICSPFDAWLVNNGIKTLPVRMEKHCANSMAIAEFLDSHPKVSCVNYTGLVSHPHHEIAKKQMRNFGGMLSFDIKGALNDGVKLMNAIRFCKLTPTLGNVDTLILHPASMSHLKVPKEIRERNGITDTLIRVSVGIEAADDIINDLSQALDAI